MVLVDVLVVLMLVAALAVGLVRGFVASAGMLAGAVAGIAASLWLAPLVAEAIPAPLVRAAAVPACWVVLIILGMALGGAVGAWLRRGVDRTPLRVLDRLAGATVSVIVTALAVSLAGSMIVATGIPGASPAVAGSAALRTIDSLIPPPVQSSLAQVRSAVAGGTVPVLRVLIPDAEASPAPAIPADDREVAAAEQSVARISGVAYACGQSLTGSGFAVSSDAVVTNAHVVAGVQQPLVQLPGKQARAGEVVWFDPAQDLAVIRAPGLDARPLAVSAPLDPGASAVVAGYPYGGPLTTAGAHVLTRTRQPVDDIYGTSTVTRDLYALAADVRPGNSGGPLLTAQGRVAGVVFARDDNDADRGYAIADPALSAIVDRLGSLTTPVASGHCTN